MKNPPGFLNIIYAFHTHFIYIGLFLTFFSTLCLLELFKAAAKLNWYFSTTNSIANKASYRIVRSITCGKIPLKNISDWHYT